VPKRLTRAYIFIFVLHTAAPFHFQHGYKFTLIVKGLGEFYMGDRLMNFTDCDIYFGIGFPHYFVNNKAFLQSGESGHSIAIQFSEDFPAFLMEQNYQQTTNIRNTC
jgi:hypothetical protein